MDFGMGPTISVATRCMGCPTWMLTNGARGFGIDASLCAHGSQERHQFRTSAACPGQ